MRIKDAKKETVDYKELEVGDCFRWEDSLLIKTDCGQDAVDLADGSVYSNMCEEEDITPVNAEIQIID